MKERKKGGEEICDTTNKKVFQTKKEIMPHLHLWILLYHL